MPNDLADRLRREFAAKWSGPELDAARAVSRAFTAYLATLTPEQLQKLKDESLALAPPYPYRSIEIKGLEP